MQQWSVLRFHPLEMSRGASVVRLVVTAEEFGTIGVRAVSTEDLNIMVSTSFYLQMSLTRCSAFSWHVVFSRDVMSSRGDRRMYVPAATFQHPGGRHTTFRIVPQERSFDSWIGAEMIQYFWVRSLP